MVTRRNISSPSRWEDKIGYSRAVVVGNIIEVSGTTATDEGGILFKGSMRDQARYCFLKIERALIEAGSSFNDVVRTRMYLTDITRWEEAGEAHAEFFKKIKPAATMVEVSGLIHPDLLIEIEVTAIIPG